MYNHEYRQIFNLRDQNIITIDTSSNQNLKEFSDEMSQKIKEAMDKGVLITFNSPNNYQILNPKYLLSVSIEEI